MNRIARPIGMTFRQTRVYFPLKDVYMRCMYEIPAWILGVLRFGLRKRGVVRFAPDHPHVAHAFRITCLLNRFKVRPASWTGAIDLAIHYQVTTVVDRNHDPGAVNGLWTDHSKTHLEDVHHRVFGYGLSVDPLVYVGPGVIKSELQGANDGRMAPFPVAEAEPGMVYQRYIDTVTVDGLCEDIAVQVLGTCIPHIRLEYRPADERRFLINQVQSAQVVEPDRALSTQEQQQVMHLARELGIDVGKFDILRDRRDGQIYVVDANTGPCLPVRGSAFPALKYWRIAIEVADVFQREMFDHHIKETRSLARPGDELKNWPHPPPTSYRKSL